jgi:hypothetical protein
MNFLKRFFGRVRQRGAQEAKPRVTRSGDRAFLWNESWSYKRLDGDIWRNEGSAA